MRDAQIKRLQRAQDGARQRQGRTRPCDALTDAAETGIAAICWPWPSSRPRPRTLGEISDAMEKVFGRHKAIIRSISGVYAAEFGDAEEIDQVRKLADEFAAREGRRPRILIAKMGQDGHDRGAKVVATAYRRPRLRRGHRPAVPDARRGRAQAVENDVHVVGMSSLAAGHKTLLPSWWRS